MDYSVLTSAFLALNSFSPQPEWEPSTHAPYPHNHHHHRRGYLLSSRLSRTPRLPLVRLLSILFSPFAFRSGQHHSGVPGSITLVLCFAGLAPVPTWWSARLVLIWHDCAPSGVRVSIQRVTVTVRPWHLIWHRVTFSRPAVYAGPLPRSPFIARHLPPTRMASIIYAC